MANQLKMAEVQTILTLHKSGYSNRKIAELTGVHRETVGRYVAQAESGNRPNAPTGSAEDNHPPPSGPVSACEPYREAIEAKLEQGLSAQRIWQDLSIGPHTKAWSEAMTQARGVEAVRVLVGLKSLAGKHSTDDLESACKVALSHGVFRLKPLRQLLKRGSKSKQQQFEFIEQHPIIRPLSDYSLSSLQEFRKERNPHGQCNSI